MTSIGEKPPGRLPSPGDEVHVKGCAAGSVYVVQPPGTEEAGLNVWRVRVRPDNGITEFWTLLANVTLIEHADCRLAPDPSWATAQAVRARRQ